MVGLQLLELHHIDANYLASTAGGDLAERVYALHTLITRLIVVFADRAQDVLLNKPSRLEVRLSSPTYLVRRVRRVSDSIMFALLARILMLLLPRFNNVFLF